MENKKTNTPKQNGPVGRRGPRGYEKAKDAKGSLIKLIKFVKTFYFLICFSIILAIAGTIFSLIGPHITKNLSSVIVEFTFAGLKIPMDKVAHFGSRLVVLYLTAFFCSGLQGWIMSGVSARISKKFRSDISVKINKLPLRYFDSTNHGEILSRITNDVDTIWLTLNQSMSQTITSCTMLIGALVMMLVTSPMLTLIALVTTPITILLAKFIVKKSQKYFVKQQAKIGELNGQIEEIYSAHNVVKAFNGEAKASEEFSIVNDELFHTAYKAQFMSGIINPIMRLIGNLTYVLVFIVGGYKALEEHVFITTMVAFTTYVRMFDNQISSISQIASTIQSAAAASERVFEFLEEEEMENDSALEDLPENVTGKVEFKNVCFGYTKDRQIINNFSFVARPGEKIAIVGPTGAGKTTIVNLLMKFYEIDSGDILYDGVSINELKRSEFRMLFSMVLQDSWLFEGTIRENIAYGNEDIEDEEIRRACEAAYVDHYIKSLPDGYDTVLDENTSLSQGQKQLFTIARAMVEKTPMLILDEATSSVDTRTEELIQAAMDKLSEGRTSFVIAHRLSTIKNANKIIVMRDGSIVECGTHDELLALDGFYAQLYNSQFEDCKD